VPGIIKAMFVITNVDTTVENVVTNIDIVAANVVPHDAIVVINDDVIIENYITPLLHCNTEVHVELLNGPNAYVHIHTMCTLAHGHTKVVVVDKMLVLSNSLSLALHNIIDEVPMNNLLMPTKAIL
jgi:hypothetical protein